MPAPDDSLAALSAAAKAALDKGGVNLVALDVSERLPLADVFLICTGLNERNVSAIASEIEDRLIEQGVKPLRREGRAEGRWVLLDFGGLVVHIFHEEDRQYYGLERLWSDCPTLPLPEEPRSGASVDVVV